LTSNKIDAGKVEAEGKAKAKALKEADEKAEAEARVLFETFDDLWPINDSELDPEVTFLNDSKFINESELH